MLFQLVMYIAYLNGLSILLTLGAGVHQLHYHNLEINVNL